MNNFVELYKFKYKLMQYEEVFLHNEIANILSKAQNLEIKNNKITFFIDKINPDVLVDLTFFYGFSINGDFKYTRQGLLELKSDGTLNNKQSTRYACHGLHEYKGKFNPQIVHAIINFLKISKDKIVFDPFNGSGTTIIECAFSGIKAFGTDINPLACFISNTKIESLNLNTDEVKKVLNEIKEITEDCSSFKIEESKRIEYLLKWIPLENLIKMEIIRLYIQKYNKKIRNFILLEVSNLIREYSLQEPSDLRIRRRISAFPNIKFIDALISQSLVDLEKIESFKKSKIPFVNTNRAINIDVKSITNSISKSVDAFITSPPYVTALPYIDTQRLSLVWLEMCEPANINKLETTLIGSREIPTKQKNTWKSFDNLNDLPESIHNLIIDMNNSISENDGFRKQSVPALTYRYFIEMKKMFKETYSIANDNAPFALVVGHNKTNLGGKEFKINTPELLSDLAVYVGWKKENIISLQTYKRYGLNAKNAINSESLIILRK